MKRTVFWTLVAVNVVLLAALVAPYIQPNSAMAQRAGASGRRPQLMMIPAQPIGGGNSDIVYLVDTANRRLGAIALNSRGNGLDSLAPQDLNRVFEDREVGGAGAGKGGKNDKTRGGR